MITIGELEATIEEQKKLRPNDYQDIPVLFIDKREGIKDKAIKKGKRNE